MSHDISHYREKKQQQIYMINTSLTPLSGVHIKYGIKIIDNLTKIHLFSFTNHGVEEYRL